MVSLALRNPKWPKCFLTMEHPISVLNACMILILDVRFIKQYIQNK